MHEQKTKSQLRGKVRADLRQISKGHGVTSDMLPCLPLDTAPDALSSRNTSGLEIGKSHFGDFISFLPGLHEPMEAIQVLSSAALT